MESLHGKLLIAEPRLPDPNFFRTVVLIIEHSEAGASGLILNRPSSISLAEVWGSVSETPLARNEVVYIGGPVEGPLAILHQRPELSERGIISGVHLSMKRDRLDELLGSAEGSLRVFSGYSGWGPGQLENEMNIGGWLTFPATPEHVFCQRENLEQLYKDICDDVGRSILFGDSPTGNSQSGKKGIDPSLN